LTGLQFTADGAHLLVTSNDSRIRLYDMEYYACVAKYKGLSNDEMQISACFSEDFKYVICGGDNRYIHVWKTCLGSTSELGQDDEKTSSKKNKRTRQSLLRSLLPKKMNNRKRSTWVVDKGNSGRVVGGVTRDTIASQDYFLGDLEADSAADVRRKDHVAITCTCVIPMAALVAAGIDSFVSPSELGMCVVAANSSGNLTFFVELACRF